MGGAACAAPFLLPAQTAARAVNAALASFCRFMLTNWRSVRRLLAKFSNSEHQIAFRRLCVAYLQPHHPNTLRHIPRHSHLCISFATSLRTQIAAHPHNRWLFQTKRATKFSTRRVQQIVKRYAEEAEVRAAPHTFRHQAITWLTRQSGMADAELQLITGHARRETLAVYQHIALDGELEAKYQKSMKEFEL
jgi:hypothetical protein